MKKEKIYLKTVILLVFLLIPNFSLRNVIAASETMEFTNSKAGYVNEQIVTVFLRNVKDDGAGIRAHAFDKGSVYMVPEYKMEDTPISSYFADENLYALPALYNYFRYQGESLGSTYAEDIFRQINDMFIDNAIMHDNSGNHQDNKFSFDQMLMLDMLSEYYKLGSNDQAYSKVIQFYKTAIDYYQAYKNTTLKGYVGGYWNLVDETVKANIGVPCYANNSLQAAIGLSKLSEVLIDVDSSLKSEILSDAETAIAFIDRYCTFSGYISEYPSDNSHMVNLLTQALAIRSYANLFSATKKYSYIFKADGLLNNLYLNMWDSGNGGFMELYNQSSGIIANSSKRGYNNVLLALGCIELFKSTGDRKYFNLAAEIMNFMYNSLLLDQGKDNYGYCELVDRDGKLGLASITLTNETRYIRTNMIALWVNAEIFGELRPFYEKYMIELIIGGVILIAVIMVIVLIIRKRTAGRSLPKIVQGLLGDEE